MQGRKHYQEKLFTTFRLSDRIPESNFYHRLNSCLDLRFLYKATKKYYGKEGQVSIDPVVFFKLLLTGYLENLQSDRRIIENARLRLDILYFIGYDIDEELPWHSTLSRTRQLYGEEVFHMLFREVLKLCIDKGMVAGRRQSIDSVFVKANASMQSVVDKDILEDGVAYIASLDETAQEEVAEKESPSSTFKKSNKNRFSPTDPDARIATKPGKPRQMNYLGQVSVDTAHHVITNIEAHHADKRDSECLEEIIDHTLDNLSSQGMEVKEIIADTNYSSTNALKAVHQHDITAYIPNFGRYKNERENFTYHADGDYYQCQQGAKLLFKGIRTSHDRGGMKQYRASVNDCGNCYLKIRCTGNKSKYKTLADSVDKWLYDEMHILMQSKYARYMRKLRSSTVEPVIGTLVNFLAMKKVNGRGLEQANKHMIGAAIAYNIKKWLNWQVKISCEEYNALQFLQKMNVSGTIPAKIIHNLRRKELKCLKLISSLCVELGSKIKIVSLKTELCLCSL
jgi:transposase